MLVVADGSLQRLLSARELADTDWHDLLLQVAPDGLGPTEARPVSPKARNPTRAATISGNLAAEFGVGCSVFVGFWDNAAQFVSPNDGGLTAVPPSAWFVDPDVVGVEEDEGSDILPGDYGDLLADEHHVIFDWRGLRRCGVRVVSR